MALPIDLKTFAKNPVVATLFFALTGISALYLDVKSTFKEQITAQGAKMEKLDHRVEVMQIALRKCDSSLSAATAKLSTLEQLGKIQNIK